MEERDTFPICTESWRLVDQSDARGPAAGEGVVQIVDGEADVMNAGPPFREEPADRTVRRAALEQLDERVAGGEARDQGAVGIVEGHLGQTEEVAIEGQDLVERAHG